VKLGQFSIGDRLCWNDDQFIPIILLETHPDCFSGPVDFKGPNDRCKTCRALCTEPIRMVHRQTMTAIASEQNDEEYFVIDFILPLRNGRAQEPQILLAVRFVE
jgi:hypothetical protein